MCIAFALISKLDIISRILFLVQDNITNVNVHMDYLNSNEKVERFV